MNYFQIKSIILWFILCLLSLGVYANDFSFKEATALIVTESRGAIQINPTPLRLEMTKGLSFVLKDKVLTPEKIFSPESIQSLFFIRYLEVYFA